MANPKSSASSRRVGPSAKNDGPTKKEELVRYSFDPSNPPPLTEAQRQRLVALAKLSDETIDFSDVPRLPEHFFKNAERGKFYRPVKRQTTLRLDADILDWFKQHADDGGARGYQTRINQALRDYVAAREKAAKKAG